MATVAQTMRHCLINYPGIFPCPMAVAVHWFTCVGTGMEWVDGELCQTYHDPEADGIMKYDDLDSLEDMLSKYSTEQNMEILSEREGRKFVEAHIDTLSNGKVTVSLFGYRPSSYYFSKGISLAYAKALNVPENITKDWAQAVYDFCERWCVALRNEYGTGSIEAMPSHIQEVFERIEQTGRIIYPVLYGSDYDTVIADRVRLTEQIMQELKNGRK